MTGVGRRYFISLREASLVRQCRVDIVCSMVLVYVRMLVVMLLVIYDWQPGALPMSPGSNVSLVRGTMI